MRHGALTTDEAIKILAEEGSIYWTEDEYSEPKSTIDWNLVAVFFNTEEIHSYGQGMVTRIYFYDPSTVNKVIGHLENKCKRMIHSNPSTEVRPLINWLKGLLK
jgi:hypothetical protein